MSETYLKIIEKQKKTIKHLLSEIEQLKKENKNYWKFCRAIKRYILPYKKYHVLMRWLNHIEEENNTKFLVDTIEENK